MRSSVKVIRRCRDALLRVRDGGQSEARPYRRSGLVGLSEFGEFAKNVIDDRAEGCTFNRVFHVVAKVRCELWIDAAGVRAMLVDGAEFAAQERTRMRWNDSPF